MKQTMTGTLEKALMTLLAAALLLPTPGLARGGATDPAAPAPATAEDASTKPAIAVSDEQIHDTLGVFRSALKSHEHAPVITAALDLLEANGTLQKAIAAALRVLLPNPDRWFVHYAVAAFRGELIYIDGNLQAVTVLSRTNAVRPGIEAVIDHLVATGAFAEGYVPPTVDATLAWGPDGSVEIYRDAEGTTQFKGHFKGAQLASEAGSMPGAAQVFVRVPDAQDDGGAVLVFADEGSGDVVYLFNDYRVGDAVTFTSDLRTRWLNANARSILRTERGEVMPTAVVLRRGGIDELAAASPKHVQFR